MKLIKEHINFERGLDPKRSMDIGIDNKNSIVQRLLQLTTIPYVKRSYIEQLYLFGNDPKRIYLTIELDRYDSIPKAKKGVSDIIRKYGLDKYIWMNCYTDLGHLYFRIKSLYKPIFKDIMNMEINEHVNFQRGIDPKDAMDTGIHASKDFSSPKEFVRFLYNNLELFTGYKPSSNLADDGNNVYFDNNDFFRCLTNYMKKCKHTINGYPVNDYEGMRDWHEIFNKLKKMFTLTETQHFTRGLNPKKAMQTGIYALVPDIKSFFVALWKTCNATPEEFPWNCYFLLENDNIVGLCYMFGDNLWYYAYFKDIKHILEDKKTPKDVIMFSKDLWLLLIDNGINVTDNALNRYDERIK